jgi:hypothetical protein
MQVEVEELQQAGNAIQVVLMEQREERVLQIVFQVVQLLTQVVVVEEVVIQLQEPGSGGTGGGGAGGPGGQGVPTVAGTAGTVNTGGGGGGGGVGPSSAGRKGGSGIVIVRAPGTANISASPGTNTVTTLPAPAGGCKVATFTVSGDLTIS